MISAILKEIIIYLFIQKRNEFTREPYFNEEELSEQRVKGK